MNVVGMNDMMRCIIIDEKQKDSIKEKERRDGMVIEMIMSDIKKMKE